MDHHERHHEHHEKEREHEKQRQKEAERAWEKSGWPIHPAWFVVLGIALTLLAILVWTFFIW